MDKDKTTIIIEESNPLKECFKEALAATKKAVINWAKESSQPVSTESRTVAS